MMEKEYYIGVKVEVKNTKEHFERVNIIRRNDISLLFSEKIEYKGMFRDGKRNGKGCLTGVV